MSHQIAIILFICGILSLIGFGAMTWFLTYYFKKKKEIKTAEFGAQAPGGNFIMIFWTNVALFIIPFTLFILGVVLIGITIQPAFL